MVVDRKPWTEWRRRLALERRRGPRGVWSFAASGPSVVQDELLSGPRSARVVAERSGRKPLVGYAENAMALSAAAFLPSPFEHAAIVVVGAEGVSTTASVGHGAGHRIDLLMEQRQPDSLADLIGLVGLWCGLRGPGAAAALDDLAADGSPAFVEQIGRLAEVRDDGSVRVDARTVRWWTRSSDDRRMRDLLGGPPSDPGREPTERDADLARSLQELLVTAVVGMSRTACRETGETNLCLTGSAVRPGVLARVREELAEVEMWVPPDPGPSGGAAGAALWYSRSGPRVATG